MGADTIIEMEREDLYRPSSGDFWRIFVIRPYVSFQHSVLVGPLRAGEEVEMRKEKIAVRTTMINQEYLEKF